MSQPNEGQDRMDYRETADVTEVHASITREHAEPRAGTMPIPTWLGVVCAGALCWAGIYVGMFHSGFSSSVYDEYQSNPGAFFPLPGGGAVTKAPSDDDLSLVELGKKVYEKNCQACHMPTGAGGSGNPPLAGSEWVVGDKFSEKRLLAIILKGLTGPVVVKGNTYNGNMETWENTLKPRQIAAVATYIRQAFGNTGTGDITEDQVLAAKKAFKDRSIKWKAEEIEAIPLTDKLEGAAPAAAAAPAADAKPAVEAAKPGATAPAAAASFAPAGFDLAASVKDGQPIYMETCFACHQANGLGIPGTFPPLAKQEWVTGDPRRLIAMVMKGINPPMPIDGKPYPVGMFPAPVSSFPVLQKDKPLADVLNYVRNNFGNTAPAISPEFVGKVRAEFANDKTPFTEETLKAFK